MLVHPKAVPFFTCVLRKETPHHRNVQATLANKVCRVLLFNKNTPRDVLVYLRDLHNELNQADGVAIWSLCVVVLLCHPFVLF